MRPPSSKPKSSKRGNDEVHRYQSRKRCNVRELETHPLSPQRSTNSGLIKLSQHSKRTRHLSGLQSRGNRRYRADGITNRRSRGKLETEAFRDTTDVLLRVAMWWGGGGSGVRFPEPIGRCFPPSPRAFSDFNLLPAHNLQC